MYWLKTWPCKYVPGCIRHHDCAVARTWRCRHLSCWFDCSKHAVWVIFRRSHELSNQLIALLLIGLPFQSDNPWYFLILHIYRSNIHSWPRMRNINFSWHKLGHLCYWYTFICSVCNAYHLCSVVQNNIRFNKMCKIRNYSPMFWIQIYMHRYWNNGVYNFCIL